MFLAALHVIHRRPAERPVSNVPSVSAPDDLSPELRRCGALAPQDSVREERISLIHHAGLAHVGRGFRDISPPSKYGRPSS
ncbi:hypothetical protein IVB02_26125 [Bradyrhizobium sp. 166]|uniref:hypothetical protein n=1 Tax=Bradyrhizobium sp. 166 TaxID=2782638 RepID=UPI001FF7A8DB|nr:hypothetical protein [Bradyrhizobium sp. 166]MCK1604784.1 hypothetical protein [Bradyrhizobium sp. 166]